MKNIIEVTYNELGKELTKQNSYIIEEESDYLLSEGEVKELVENRVPSAMVKSYELKEHTFYELKEGQYVKLNIVENDSKGDFMHGCKSDEQISAIDDKYIYLLNHNYKFKKIDGYAKNNKRNKVFITMLSNNEVKGIEERVYCEKLWNKIAKVFCPYVPDYDISYPFTYDKYTLIEIAKLLEINY